jgi:tetratricopeptide (TPR) repeat protein
MWSLGTQEKVYGLRSPQVAYVLNKTGMLAQQQNDFKTAIRDDLRSYEIYRSSYGDGDYRVGLAMANVGSVYLAEKQYAQAEKSFTDALGLLQKERSDDSVDTAIVHIKLGRALLFESRYREAETQTRGGYEVLLKQASPQTSFIKAALEDLVKIYGALGQPKDAQEVRDELAKTENAGAETRHSP